jgi:alpha-ribazole phosphatase
MRKRAMAAFSRLEDNSVVITHGGVIAAIMASIYPQEQKNRYQWQPKPGYGYRITSDGYCTIP